ncbi:MAG: D-alanyl-D-alanine carboxypeptidase family protein [Lysobacteraceae bacterium]|nr:MAG: D-alanyl-D-alanine carboxypeptidase family protein [Xanthomonadaceae bacterium]
MRPPPRTLINTPDIEIWPAWLLRVRSNRDARIVARAKQILRRKRDGRMLAAALPGGMLAGLDARWRRQPGIDTALDALHMPPIAAGREPQTLPLHRLHERLQSLGLDESYADRAGLALIPEPQWLSFAGFDRYRRALWLHPAATTAWLRMRAAALEEGIAIDAVSGYRSHDYQLGIFERKLARGLSIGQILEVNAAPGYSEHHSGRALDIGTPGEAPAEESFERTPAFEWLRTHAGRYGFAMSYPRDNPHGIIYEPWHWCWHPD